MPKRPSFRVAVFVPLNVQLLDLAAVDSKQTLHTPPVP